METYISDIDEEMNTKNDHELLTENESELIHGETKIIKKKLFKKIRK